MNNTLILQDCLEEFICQNELGEIKHQDAFEMFSILQITKESETSYDELSSCIVDGGLDGGIDSFIILVNDKAINSEDQLPEIKIIESSNIQIFINQSKYENSFKEGPINNLQSSMPIILDIDALEDILLERFNPLLVEKILLFRSIWRLCIKKKASINLKYTYSSKSNEICINKSFQSKVDQLIAFTKNNMNIDNIGFKLYSAKELLTIYSKQTSKELELKFKENPVPVSFRETEFGYIGIVALNDYYNFITNDGNSIRENIFENNIRHYQGAVDVNNNISLTLRNDNENDFWWLNNGITIIASNCRPLLKTLFLEDPQIVNGLQTSYTIGKYYSEPKNENRSILIKVIQSNNKKTIDKIISASNSQNPVPPSLLRATDDIQRDLEIYCLNKGYYYDRRKNYYKNKQKPANKIISIQNMAQAIEAILNYSPANARSKPTTLIKEEISYKKIFNPNIDFGAYLTCSIICQKVADFIKNNVNSDEKGIQRNFMYHLARVTVSFILCKHNYNSDEIARIREDSISIEKIKDANDFLAQVIYKYRESNPKENIINISKSNKFVTLLNDSLKIIFND
ncbi:AIPR family protein [Ruminiclostridium papyrosolvens]|uniref:Abortive phage infection protein C-terminal domain-containing protein n=1 Tax=Ruminiclostridium papyrosolvens C7 TaxID=1330534 RepID=U4QWT9_9FIRM|nr:AIPR family protein [Ruminiclostridium papyrosolvens]EPR07796.1 hypothetical protein L323_20085 [Ruminiclostridium papyrosolvens C7]